MAKPPIPTIPAPALRSQPSLFSANMENTLLFFPTLATYMDDVCDFVDERADEALAAALGGTLPALTGHANEFIRVNGAGTAVTFKRAAALTAGAVTGDIALTAVGKAIIEAADAAAQRTALGLGAVATKGFSSNTDLTVSGTSIADRTTILANLLGVNQTWQDLTASRAANTQYQNLTGKPIQVIGRVTTNTNIRQIEVSVDGLTWIPVDGLLASATATFTMIVPNNWYYRINGTVSSVIWWSELRT